MTVHTYTCTMCKVKQKWDSRQKSLDDDDYYERKPEFYEFTRGRSYINHQGLCRFCADKMYNLIIANRHEELMKRMYNIELALQAHAIGVQNVYNEFDKIKDKALKYKRLEDRTDERRLVK